MHKTTLSALLVCLCATNIGHAAPRQVMSTHLYLVPVIGTGVHFDPRRAKYSDGHMSSAIDYGFQPVMLLAMTVDDATDASVSAQADVQRIPDNLDSTIGPAAVAIVQNALETRNIPAGWVATAMTYRTLIRTIVGMFFFIQRYAVIANTSSLLLGGAVDLETQFNQLSAPVRTNLQNTAASFNLDTSGLSGNSTIRVILKNIADQMGNQPVNMGILTI